MTFRRADNGDPTLPVCLRCNGVGYTINYDALGRGFVYGCVPCNGSGREGGEDPLEARRKRLEGASRD